MGLFHYENRERNARTQRLYALVEILHTVVDLIAAITFLLGSILFFSPSYETVATWFFVIGSVFFCLKPTLRLVREVKLASIGDTDDLAKRYNP